MAEKYPHKGKGHKCGNCAKDGTKCDENKNGSGYHCFIRVMCNPYLSCMFCGRWERLK